MTVRRYLTERLRDPGSDRTLCSAPLPPSPPVVGSGDDDDVDWVARGLSSSGDGSIVASMLRWSSASLLLSGGDGGGAGMLGEFLAGVRRTSIEAEMYKAGWTRLSAGRMKRRAAAVAAGPGTGSRGRGASSGVAGDGDGQGLDDRVADAPPSRFGEGGLSSRPLSIVAYP
jgi:hypothetical protein